MKKSEMNFKDSKSLASVRNVINEANEALNNKSRTIADSAIPESLAGALGAGAGGVASFSDYCVDFPVSECFPCLDFRRSAFNACSESHLSCPVSAR